MENNKVDIKENYILKIDEELLSILLKDKSSGKNIIWATDTYKSRGPSYQNYEFMTVNAVSGRFGQVIKPRVEKSKKEQEMRIKNKAEVFTPSWICNKQNNLIDAAWFGRENIFNIEQDTTWETNIEKIDFSNLINKTWIDYVKENRLEVSCGEAPYLVSRYDTVTGNIIDVKDRIGLLDRKLRTVSENVENEKEWVEYAYLAIKSIFGYDWQGDNVLLARENILFTFADYYLDKFGIPPIKSYLVDVANIVVWNIWQMDGLKYIIPNSCKPIPKIQISMFDDESEEEECPGCLKNNIHKHSGIYCKIMNWETKRSIKFISLIGRKS